MSEEKLPPPSDGGNWNWWQLRGDNFSPVHYATNLGTYLERWIRIRRSPTESELASRRASARSRSKKHAAKHPVRVKARRDARAAILRGRMERGVCEQCGTTEGVEGHHHDYSKPLEVRWLCKRCHEQEHARQGQ